MSDRDRQVAQPSLFDVPDTAPASEHQLSLPPEGGSHANAVLDSEPRATDHGLRTTAGEQREQDSDADARAYAVDPRHNVVLEASAGTGKTSVLVTRYVNLLKAGVDPANILAITFTRKAAAEMRERILRELRRAAATSELDRARWLDLRDRLGDIAISTIDAFCLSLLREFPLEADIDPAFELADETEVPRLIATSLDRTMRILVAIAREDRDVALVLAQLGIGRTRDGLTTLVDRRLVARDALDRFLARGPRHLEALQICRDAAAALEDVLQAIPGGLAAFLQAGPHAHPRYSLFLRDVRRLESLGDQPEAVIRSVLERVSGHFLTNEGKARKGSSIYPYNQAHYPTKDAMKRHRDAVFAAAPRVEQVMFAFNRDLNVVLARGVRRMFAVALDQYRRALEERAVLDFSDVLEKALQLLRQMDEFSQSRYRLESRFHHVLVDEFQDTSRAQWELVSLLVQAWGEGLGLAANPSIFVVGDRKQSIYRFRDADVAVLQHAAEYIQKLRPEGRPRRSIARSFRAVPGLLHFVNDVFTEMSQPDAGSSGFTYEDRDRFPVEPGSAAGDAVHEPILGVAVAETPDECAAAVADEIAKVLDGSVTVRDKGTGLARPARPGDIGILFRSRSTHREFERELNARNIPTHVYKGLGFFDADEIKDVVALIRYLAEPTSHLRAAAFLRSRFIRLSDAALAKLSPDLASVLMPAAIDADARLDDEDREVLAFARPAVARWLALVDRINAGGAARRGARRDGLRVRARRTETAPGLGKPQEDARPRPAHAEPRLRHAAAHRRLPDLAQRRRRIQRRGRGARLGQPDDRARRQGPRVSHRLRRQSGERRERPAAAGARDPRFTGRAVGERRSFRLRYGRGGKGARASRNASAAVCGAHARSRSLVSRIDLEGGRIRPRPRQPGGSPAGIAQGVLRRRGERIQGSRHHRVVGHVGARVRVAIVSNFTGNTGTCRKPRRRQRQPTG